MIYLCEKERCTGCEACFNACNQKAIRMKINCEGFLYPEIQRELCIQCGLCRKACPVIEKPEKERFHTKTYAIKVNDGEVRERSSSGGFFTIIAEYVLQNKGVVFGAAYDPDYIVQHIEIDSIEDLYKLNQSKYAQSRVNNTFSRVRDLLNQGKMVLYSGTPCQISGLKKYLKEKWDTLITVDLICHGVPSPGLWKKYVDYRSKIDNHDGKPCEINMRSKITGWPAYSVRFQYPSGVDYCSSFSNDLYMKAYLLDLNLRESCYSCNFRETQRISDFTLGDYWGIWKHMPEFDDHKGTSIVLIHSKKGREIFNAISNEITFRKISIKSAIEDNPSLVTSPSRPTLRDIYYTEIHNEFLDLTSGVIKQPVSNSRKIQIRKLIKAGIKKIIKVAGK